MSTKKRWIFSVCAPPPSLVSAYHLHPPDARAIFLHNDLTCKNTCSVWGSITYWGTQTEKIRNRNDYTNCNYTMSLSFDANSSKIMTTLIDGRSTVTSASCDLAMSTRVLAAGCTIWSSLRIVAPSLEMVDLPLVSTMSLSMPLGPRVVLTESDTTSHALMLLMSCCLPCRLSVPSFITRIGAL